MHLAILGGMGPDASADFLAKYVMAEFHRSLGQEFGDQQVPPITLLSRPVLDRTAALMLERSGNFDQATIVRGQLQTMVDEAKAIGATHFAIVCNTAHAFMDGSEHRDPVDHRDMMFIDIREAALNAVPESIETVGIMATRGTHTFGLYEAKANRQLIVPDAEHIQLCMEGIYDGVKANNLPLAKARFRAVGEHLLSRGCGAVLEACTEIPLGMEPIDGLVLIDPNKELAKVCVSAVLGG
jgi:aspartate racemase